MRSFISCLTVAFISFSSFAQINLSQELVAYHPFNGNVSDRSGNNNYPSFNNATLTADRTVNPNGTYYFNIDCSGVNIAGGNQSIRVSGLSAAPIVGVQVFNSSWASVFNQAYTNPQDTVLISSLSAGQYFVNVHFYNHDWSTICEKGANATVTPSNPPPPPPPNDSCSTVFQKTFGTTGGDESGNDIVKTSDGGYVIAGKSSSSGTSSYDALLMKFDSKGNLIWSKTYGGAQEDLFFSVKATIDGGFIAAGMTRSFGNTNGDAWLVKTDANGNILWQKRYTDSTNPEFIFDLTTTSDGGYAFIGDYPFTPGLSQWMVVKTDASGNIQWQKIIGSNSSDDGLGIIEDNHGTAGLVVTGFNWSSTGYDANLTKLDLANGNLLWTKSYDFDGRTNRLGQIYAVSDGFIVNGVTADGFGATNPVQTVLKTDFNGNLIFVKEYKPSPPGWNGVITTLAGGGFMIALGENPEDPNTDFHLMRVDAAGNINWTKKYPQPDIQVIQRILTDGNYVVGVGQSKSGSYNDVMLVKADLAGNIGNCPAVSLTGTVRNPSVTNIPYIWETNTNNTLTTANSSAAGIAFNPASKVLCADSCKVPPTISINNVTVAESVDSAALQICLSAISSQPVTVQYSTANGTALAGSDYYSRSGTLTIPAGQTCGTVMIGLNNDAIAEPTENFTVNLSNPTNATILNGTGTVTITDDDQPGMNCGAVTINPGNRSIKLKGLLAPVVTVQVFNSSWVTVFNQSYTNTPDSLTISPIGAGAYVVKVTFYSNSWTYICDKSQNVTVTDQCPPGAICISNNCPAQTVNLNSAYSIPNLPAGTTVSWHTGTPATDANRLTPSQAQNVSTSGTYYAAINISGNNCYSSTITVMVTIDPCGPTTIAATSASLKSQQETARRVSIAPNPFATSIRITVDTKTREKATLVFTDLFGRQLAVKPVQLHAGINQLSMDGLGKFPAGSYFLQILSKDGIETFKLLRQQ